MKKLLTLLPVLVLAGCATPQAVPATHIVLDPKTGKFELTSPKNVKATNVVVQWVDGHPNISIGSIVSENDPNTIAEMAKQNVALATQNTEQGKIVLDGLKQVRAMGAQGASGGMIPGGVMP